MAYMYKVTWHDLAGGLHRRTFISAKAAYAFAKHVGSDNWKHVSHPKVSRQGR